jgi:hypothetical protein
MSARVAPWDPYRLPLAGSVANNETRDTTLSSYNGNVVFKNSRGQLSAAQMDKISRLAKTTDTLYHKLYEMVKSRVCLRKPQELNLSLYSNILKDPSQSQEAKYDVMLQLIALKQVFKGERVIDRNTVSIFKKNEKALTVIGVVIACIGFVMPLAAFGDMVAHVDPEFVSANEKNLIDQYKLLYPNLSDEEINKKFENQITDIKIKASLLSGASERPISAALSSMGTGILGFIPSLITGLVTAFVAPIPVTLIINAGKDIVRNVNLKMTVAELEKIINDPENPPGLAEAVENELNVTAIEPPPPEQLQRISAPVAAAPLQSMNEFMNRGVGANGLPRYRQTLSNFTRNSSATRRAWEDGPFTSNHTNNARLNTEWTKTQTKTPKMPEATRSANGKKSALKKRGGRKTRKNHR